MDIDTYTLTSEQKTKIFEPMFEKFETEEILEYFKEALTRVPPAIFYKPASSSGKYHNSQQTGKYGQLIHIYMFFDILNMLLDLEYNRNKFNDPIERDLMRCIPVLHDMCKYNLFGTSKHTTSYHPLAARKRLIQLNNQKNFHHPLTEDQLQMLGEMCERHSGQWNTWKKYEYNFSWEEGNKTEIITGEMEKPQNDRDMLIHECDMLSSRNFLVYDLKDELRLIELFDKYVVW